MRFLLPSCAAALWTASTVVQAQDPAAMISSVEFTEASLENSTYALEDILTVHTATSFTVGPIDYTASNSQLEFSFYAGLYPTGVRCYSSVQEEEEEDTTMADMAARQGSILLDVTVEATNDTTTTTTTSTTTTTTLTNTTTTTAIFQNDTNSTILVESTSLLPNTTTTTTTTTPPTLLLKLYAAQDRFTYERTSTGASHDQSVSLDVPGNTTVVVFTSSFLFPSQPGVRVTCQLEPHIELGLGITSGASCLVFVL